MLARQQTAPCFSCHRLSSIVDSRRGLLPKSRPSAHVQVKVGGFDGRARNLPWRGCPLRREQRVSHRNLVRGRVFSLAFVFSVGFSFTLLLGTSQGWMTSPG